MKLGKWALAIAALMMCFGVSADAQLEGNRLCIHSGGEFYVNGPFYGFSNHGSGRYFPSFSHWTASSVNNAGVNFPWKVAGYAWTGMQGNVSSNSWYFETCLQTSVDNPRQPNGWMSFDYPILFQGTVSPTGYPQPIYGGGIASSVPAVGGNNWNFPSSMGGFNSYLNIVAGAAGSWTVPSTQPFYSWLFGYNWGCGSAVLTVPSSTSFWQHVWVNKGPNNEYVIMDGDSVACDGSGGNKGRNYSIITDSDNGYLWAWTNAGTGVNQEWAMCLFVCDVVTVPANYPGTTNTNNPFAAYGFDVGTPTLTPYMSSLQMSLGFMTEDWANESAGMPRAILGGLGLSGGASGAYGGFNYRVPFAWDFLTTVIANNAIAVFVHTPAPAYPGCMWGTTTGANSISLFQANAGLVGLEVRWASFPANPLAPMSASYMATYF